MDAKKINLLLQCMQKLFFPILIALLLFFIKPVSCQVSIKDKGITIPMIYAAYSYQFPGNDMKERFGGTSQLGPGFQVKTSSNWIIGAEFDFIFGSNVKNGFDILEDIMTSDGNIINGDGVPSVVALFERGYNFNVRFGKLFAVLSPNPNSGIVIMGGIGYLQHKISIQVENESAPQLKGDYKRGYDRLSGGFAINEFIGYMYLSNSRILNFMVGVEFFQSWTKSKREYLFDLMGPDKEKRFDTMIGPKLVWMIPLHKRAPKEFYYN